ncbi:unnamed protein product [Vitrella brassicaformis CCMP3155]|uniref:Uncharacterized protein n=3 Tax=Vitrella brassicaformis TaxID=1169539 RepID=A0A0G4GSD1_VITBC|nr:unnamed protein product [Vitrella brassicaformis CCMP3155]|eukprot:CEM33528.1 unnamed protein product [Vitrella brassicaformis CCMP3155]
MGALLCAARPLDKAITEAFKFPAEKIERHQVFTLCPTLKGDLWEPPREEHAPQPNLVQMELEPTPELYPAYISSKPLLLDDLSQYNEVLLVNPNRRRGALRPSSNVVKRFIAVRLQKGKSSEFGNRVFVLSTLVSKRFADKTAGDDCFAIQTVKTCQTYAVMVADDSVDSFNRVKELWACQDGSIMRRMTMKYHSEKTIPLIKMRSGSVSDPPESRTPSRTHSRRFSKLMVNELGLPEGPSPAKAKEAWTSPMIGNSPAPFGSAPSDARKKRQPRKRHTVIVEMKHSDASPGSDSETPRGITSARKSVPTVLETIREPKDVDNSHSVKMARRRLSTIAVAME